MRMRSRTAASRPNKELQNSATALYKTQHPLDPHRQEAHLLAHSHARGRELRLPWSPCLGATFVQSNVDYEQILDMPSLHGENSRGRPLFFKRRYCGRMDRSPVSLVEFPADDPERA